MWHNWAGNIQSQPQEIIVVESEAQLVSIVKQAANEGRRVKVVGSGHSCSAIAGSDGALLVSLDKLDSLVAVDHQTGHVTVQAGIRLGALNRLLDEHGLAMPNLGTIDVQSIAGAISTATHGTGLRYGTLSSFVVRLRLVLASGEVVETSADNHPALFQAARTGLGCIGIITEVTLACVPKFNIQMWQSAASFDEALDRLDDYLENERFGLWWYPHTDKVRLWTSNSTQQPADPVSFWTRAKTRFKDVVLLNRGHEAAMWAGSWKPSLVPKINRFFQKRFYSKPFSRVVKSTDGFKLTILVKQHVMEYALPIEKTAEALRKLKQLIDDHGFKVHHPVEVRFTAADEAWLSPTHGRPSCYIGIIMYRPFGRVVPYEDYFKQVDKLFFEMGGRPHWGKIHYRSADDFASLYPHWHDFLAIRQEVDPQGLFLNRYLEQAFGIGEFTKK